MGTEFTLALEVDVSENAKVYMNWRLLLENFRNLRPHFRKQLLNMTVVQEDAPDGTGDGHQFFIWDSRVDEIELLYVTDFHGGAGFGELASEINFISSHVVSEVFTHLLVILVRLDARQ